MSLRKLGMKSFVLTCEWRYFVKTHFSKPTNILLAMIFCRLFFLVHLLSNYDGIPFPNRVHNDYLYLTVS